MPERTTASIKAKLVEVDATYNRRKRNQIISRLRKTAPVPILTNSNRHGGLSPNERWNLGFFEVPCSTVGDREEKGARSAEMQPIAAAAKAVPKSPIASTRKNSPSSVPPTAPKV